MSIKSRFDQPVSQLARAECATKWRKRLDEESRRERRAIILCVTVGFLLNGIVVAASLLLAEIAARLGPQPRATAYVVCLCVAATVCALMLIVAVFTKPQGRAEISREIFNQGCHQAIGQDHAEGGLVFSLAIIIALYGGFAVVEASKRTFVRAKLVSVDRDQTARILAEICSVPAGVPWRNLLQPGEPIQALRGPLALLMLDGWIQIVDGGRTVAQRTPAMRKALYRHPLAEIFALEKG